MNLGPQVYFKTILGFGVIVDLRNLLSIVLYRLSWPFNSTSPFQLNPSHQLLNLFKYFPSKIKYFLALKSLYSSSYHPITLFTANLKEAPISTHQFPYLPLTPSPTNLTSSPTTAQKQCCKSH